MNLHRPYTHTRASARTHARDAHSSNFGVFAIIHFASPVFKS